MSGGDVNWKGLHEEVLHRLFTVDRSTIGAWARLEFLNLRKLSKVYQARIDSQVKEFKPASLKLLYDSFQHLQNVNIIDFTKFQWSCDQQKISSTLLDELGSNFQNLNRVIICEKQVNYLADLIKVSSLQQFVVEVKGLNESRFQIICLFLDVLHQKRNDLSQNLKYFQLEIYATLEQIMSLLGKARNLPVKFDFTVSQMVNNLDKLDSFYNQWGDEDQITGLNCCYCPDISPFELVLAAEQCPSFKKLAVYLTGVWCTLTSDQVVCLNQLEEFYVSSPCLGYESGASFLLENGLTKLSSIRLWQKDTSFQQFLLDIQTTAQSAPDVSCVQLASLFGSQWMDSVCQFQNLRELSIEGFNFSSMRSGDDLLKLGELSKLRSLKLHGCGGELPYSFSSLFRMLTKLQELEICLFRNRFGMFEALSPLYQLRRLVIECVDPSELQDKSVFLFELKQLRYVHFKLASPFLLNTNSEEVERVCEEISKFMQEVFISMRKVVVRGPKHKSVVYK
eukprot:TRINITY_DN27018_c0_g2_i1.p1 TRINITY_DN27018_c0_g2~~TRINITY_DN27018_c0_g2_i1.p1  ORF type:complete len:508 (-),score=61.36 TRINITY_DN27018_c0_g2_i1:842-2365(-)